MYRDIIFFLNSALLGVGLAMDAFSVSLANGLNEPHMRKSKMYCIAGTFAAFQAIMPMLGWVCIHTVVEKFEVFEKFIPWISLILLLYIGGKMLLDGIRGEEKSEKNNTKTGFGALILQGIATSIDAFSVGFTIASYDWFSALLCSLVIATVTFVICAVGVMIGKKFGTKLSNKAEIFGGAILIIIGLEIFIRGIIDIYPS